MMKISTNTTRLQLSENITDFFDFSEEKFFVGVLQALNHKNLDLVDFFAAFLTKKQHQSLQFRSPTASKLLYWLVSSFDKNLLEPQFTTAAASILLEVSSRLQSTARTSPDWLELCLRHIPPRTLQRFLTSAVTNPSVTTNFLCTTARYLSANKSWPEPVRCELAARFRTRWKDLSETEFLSLMQAFETTEDRHAFLRLQLFSEKSLHRHNFQHLLALSANMHKTHKAADARRVAAVRTFFREELATWSTALEAEVAFWTAKDFDDCEHAHEGRLAALLKALVDIPESWMPAPAKDALCTKLIRDFGHALQTTFELLPDQHAGLAENLTQKNFGTTKAAAVTVLGVAELYASLAALSGVFAAISGQSKSSISRFYAEFFTLMQLAFDEVAVSKQTLTAGLLDWTHVKISVFPRNFQSLCINALESLKKPNSSLLSLAPESFYFAPDASQFLQALQNFREAGLNVTTTLNLTTFRQLQNANKLEALKRLLASQPEVATQPRAVQKLIQQLLQAASPRTRRL